MRPAVIASLGVLLAVGFSCNAKESTSFDRTFGQPQKATALRDPEINESSGIARSYAQPGLFYTHNDSGDKPRFWRFDLTGKTSGPFTLPGASAVDWEDMASAKLGEKPLLYFADIGDNAEKRSSVQIYVVEEPTVEKGSLDKVDTFELKYPDGPHNAEAFLVDPRSGDFTIVAKTAKGASKIFRLDRPSKAGSFTLDEVGSVEVGTGMDAAKLITAGDYSPDGKFVVLRSYLSAYEFDVPADGAWWKAKPRTIKTAAEMQGEAICYSLDGDQLITTSEFAPCPVSIVPISSGKGEK